MTRMAPTLGTSTDSRRWISPRHSTETTKMPFTFKTYSIRTMTDPSENNYFKSIRERERKYNIIALFMEIFEDSLKLSFCFLIFFLLVLFKTFFWNCEHVLTRLDLPLFSRKQEIEWRLLFGDGGFVGSTSRLQQTFCLLLEGQILIVQAVDV